MKNKILYGVMVTLFCTFSASVNGQLKIAENGCVGIKCSSPMSNLSIGSNGISNAQLYLYSQAGSGTQYGIYSKLIYGTNSTWRTAVYGLSQALSGHIAGVKGEALSPNNSTSNFYAYGVYGLAGWSSMEEIMEFLEGCVKEKQPEQEYMEQIVTDFLRQFQVNMLGILLGIRMLMETCMHQVSTQPQMQN